MSSSKHASLSQIVHGGELSLRIPGIKLEPDAIWNILGEITKDYPELNKPDVRDHEQKQIFLLSAETPSGEQKDLVSIRSNFINILTLERYENEVWEKRYIDILSRIAKSLSIGPLTVVHVDSTLVVDWKTRVNHTRVLRNALALGNLFGAGFSPMNLLWLRLETYFQMDSTEEIVCKIYFESDAQMKNNKIERYPDPLLLRFHCGVAKIGNFVAETSIDDVLKNVCCNARAIFDGKFKEGVIEPISRFIAQQEMGEEKPPNAQ